MSNADVCRERGWAAGTEVEVRDDFGEARFVITAVGEGVVLARQTACREFGFPWSSNYGCKRHEEVVGFNLRSAYALAPREEVPGGG